MPTTMLTKKPRCRLSALLPAALLAACAATPSRPILYPNEHLRQVGQAQARRDIAECEALARQAGASAGDRAETVATRTATGAGIGAASGAVGGAITGAPGTGAAIGAAGAATAALLQGLLASSPPSPAYVAFVNRCLGERGYELTGWQ